MKLIYLITITLFLTACNNYKEKDFKLDNTDALILEAKDYDKIKNSTAVIFIPGNGEKYNKLPPKEDLNFILSKGYLWASVQIQDESKEPFTNNNTGWGNKEALDRVLNLYNYLNTNYGIKDVILIGESMGGLTMGQIISKNLIPVKEAIGIGPVPSLEIIFNNAEKRQVPIRNAWNLSHDGNQDHELKNIYLNNDWYYLLDSVNHKLPNTYIYYGIDNVVNNDFGGVESYNLLVDKLKHNADKVILKTNNSDSHTHKSLINLAISDSIF